MSAPTTPPAAPAPWWHPVVIIAAALVAYHNSLDASFVFDDASSIETNPTIRDLSRIAMVLAGPETNVTAQGRPILNLSLAINHALGGTAVRGYHVGNLLIHALAGLALFGLVRRTLDLSGVANAAGIACAVAVLWAVHPLQTESVTYVIQRAESLVGLFYLLTLYCFVRGWFALSLVACILGMATKEVMATAPLMVLFFDRTFFAGTFVSALRRRPFFYAVLASTWLLLGWLVAQGGGNRGGSVGFGVGIAWWEYWLTQFKTVVHYLWLSFWPHPLVFEYGAFWIQRFSEIALPLVVVAGLLGATILALWRRSAAGFLGAWFFGILAPTSLAPGTTQMIVEHRMYLPLAAVLVAGVLSIRAVLVAKRRMALGVVLAAAVALVALTVRRNHDYRSEIALWTDTVAKAPTNPLAHFMLADAHERASNVPAALASYERTLQLKPNFSIGHERFGELLLKLSRRAEAIAHLEIAVRLQPEFDDAHANLGIAYLAENRIADALRHLKQAARLAPGLPLRRYQLGNALTIAGRPEQAVAELAAAVRLDPGLAEAQFALGNVLVELQRTPEAIAHYRAAIQARPDFATAHYNLANTLAASGRQQDAIAHYEAALRARPDFAEAHHNLGSALLELGYLAKAARHYEETLRIAPAFPGARDRLEHVRARMKDQ